MFSMGMGYVMLQSLNTEKQFTKVVEEDIAL